MKPGKTEESLMTKLLHQGPSVSFNYQELKIILIIFIGALSSIEY